MPTRDLFILKRHLNGLWQWFPNFFEWRLPC